jgi:hypothetical protein
MAPIVVCLHTGTLSSLCPINIILAHAPHVPE